jgi:hypothetical protein
VLQGRYVTLRWKATDNLARSVTAIKIVVRNAKGKVVKVFRPIGTRSVGVWHGPHWRCMTKGVFRYYVYAKDRAGNPQIRRGSARIVVR